jgi:transcriptional regulator with XRE-family HTH domain
MSESHNSIGDALRRTRKRASMTQDDLAKRSGLSRNYIAQIETGKKSLTLKALSALADGIGVTLEAIISEDAIIVELRKIIDQGNARRVLEDLKQVIKQLS